MVQLYVSQLRKALAGADGGAEIVTRGRGYELRLARDESTRAASSGWSRGGAAPRRGAARCGAAAPLADVADEPFAAAEIRRLEELRLTALRAGDRRRPRRRPPPRGRRRARGAGRRGAAARAPARAADARAVSLGRGRPRRWRPTATLGARSSRRSGSSRARSCGACTRRSCARTRRSIRRRPTRPSCRPSSTPASPLAGREAELDAPARAVAAGARRRRRGS